MLEEYIADNEQLSNIDKQVFMRMARLYEEDLPETLYKNPYQLEDEYEGSAEQWKKFLRLPEINRFIETEIATMTEIAARRSLQQLQSGKASTQDIQAAKELLSSSKLLKNKTQRTQQHVIVRIPPKEME